MAREYKDSGIEWIGQIPKEWEVIPLKWVIRAPLQYGANETGLLYKGDLPRYVRITDIINNNLREDIQKQSLTEEQAEGYILEDKDILFARSGATVGKAFIYKNKYGRCAYAGYLIRAQLSSNYCPEFVYYYTQSHAYEEWKKQIFIQATIQNIGADRYSMLEISFPSFSEQQKIVDYLDKVCGEVDEMVALQETMIEELKAYKQSVITEAVTKGLNPSAPMRNSGIDWIGEIPEQWDTGKTLYVLSMPITDGPHTTPDLFDDGVPFISADAVSDGYINFDNKRGFVSKEFYDECCKKYIPQLYDVYMIKSGASTGKTAIVETQETFTIWSPLAVFRANPEVMTPYYLLYMLRSDGYQKQVETFWSYGTQQNIGMRTLEKLIVCIPPLDEQHAIASYLDTKCSEIDSLIALKQAKIEELKEYKKSVIYEYVTGKKEVI